MRKILAFLGATVGGYAGWYLGAPFSFFTAFILSAIGSGVGMWLGIRFSQRYG